MLGFKKYNSSSVNWVDSIIYELLKEKKTVKNKTSHLIAKMKKHFKSSDVRDGLSFPVYFSSKDVNEVTSN